MLATNSCAMTRPDAGPGETPASQVRQSARLAGCGRAQTTRNQRRAWQVLENPQFDRAGAFVGRQGDTFGLFGAHEGLR